MAVVCGCGVCVCEAPAPPPHLPRPLSVAVCSLVGDPYTPSQVLSPWLRHQLVCLNEGSGALFLGSVADKQHHVCTLTFHSALSETTPTHS